MQIMIQIYSPENTDFKKNGDMTLFPTSATVTAELNGAWEAKLIHPIDEDGRWKYIKEEAVVKMESFNGEQLFRIKKKEKSDSGVTATLRPIFFDAKEDCFLMDVRPEGKNGQQALDKMTTPNKKYKATSNITKCATAYYINKNLIEAICSEEENSFINRWGGEVIYNNFEVIINERAGGEYGTEILYGKNIAQNGFRETVDMNEVVTRIIPQGYNGHMIEGETPWVDSENIDKYPTIKYAVIKFDDVKMHEDAREDDEGIVCYTKEELKEELTKKCKEQFEKGADKPKVSIEIEIVALENTEEYKDVKNLEKIRLGDTVHCRNEKFDVVTDARAVEIEWDCLDKTVKNVIIGDPKYNYINGVESMMNRVESAIREDGSVVGQQVRGIIDGIKTQLKAQTDEAKKTDVKAVLMEDLDPESKTFGAMCLGTMGFQIANKRTADGREWDWRTFGTGQGFFADYIIAGTMLADRILGGTLKIGGINNANGIMRMLDSYGKVRGGWDNNGIHFNDENGNKIEIRALPYGDGMANLYIAAIKKGTDTINKYISVSPEIIGMQNDDVEIMAKKGVKISAGTIDVAKEGGPYKSAKTGRMEFSDGTHAEYINGILVGGNTKEGEF